MKILMDKLNDNFKISKKIKKPTQTNASKKCIYLIKSNTFNYSNKAHVLYRNIAIKQGFIDIENNIIKEV